MPSCRFIPLCVLVCLLQSVVSHSNRGSGISTSGRYGRIAGLGRTSTGFSGIGGRLRGMGGSVGLVGGSIGIGSNVGGVAGIGSGSIGGITESNVIIDTNSGYSIYGGYGTGNMAVLGDMPVTGTTAINGQVPVIGAVTFNGQVPAAGSVSISGTCGCPCSFSSVNY